MTTEKLANKIGTAVLWLILLPWRIIAWFILLSVFAVISFFFVVAYMNGDKVMAIGTLGGLDKIIEGKI